MQFSKQCRKYLDKQLYGNISNNFKFVIKDLYRTTKVGSFSLCKSCQSIASGNRCLFCNQQTGLEIENNKSNICRNICFVEPYKKNNAKAQSIIFCVDISGSMGRTFLCRSLHSKKYTAISNLGKQNFSALASIIGEEQVIKNYENIQVQICSGFSIQDIGLSYKHQKNMVRSLQQQNKPHYISRKQIIQNGINSYIEAIKANKPNTLITIVYFNSQISIPINNFNQRIVIGNLQDKSVEEMIEIGSQHAKQISIKPINDIGDKLNNYMAETITDSQTALGPAVAFCLGLAKQFKHQLHQIVIVTDGLSNVGFGKTQQQKDLPTSRALFQRLAIDYAVKYACVINVICFEGAEIGYQVIDKLVKNTSGLPYQIVFSQQKQQQVVTQQTIDYLKIEMGEFIEVTKQFCFDTKLIIQVNQPTVKIIIPKQYTQFINYQTSSSVGLSMGIRLFGQSFKIVFQIPEGQQFQGTLKFTIICQYTRKDKKNYVLREEIIKVFKGSLEQKTKQQCTVLTKQIAQTIKNINLEDSNVEEYKTIQRKLQNQDIANNIDQKILEKFNKCKKKVYQYDKCFDNSQKDKMTIRSRRNQTYKKRKDISDDDQNAFS